MVMLSDFLRFRLIGSGGRQPRLVDLAVDLSAGDYPPVTRMMLRERRARTELLSLPWSVVEDVDWLAGAIKVASFAEAKVASLEELKRAVLLRRDVLDALVIDLQRRNATLANDLWLEGDGQELRLRAADIGKWAVVRRLARGWLGRGGRGHLLDWKDVEFLRGNPKAARAGGDYHRRVTRLQAGEIARLVDALPYLHAAELLALIPDQMTADALEVMSPERQLQVFEEFDEEMAVHVLALMAPDAAADLLGYLKPELAKHYLERLPAGTRAKLIELLRYPQDSAGGIMTNDVPILRAGLTVAEARRALLEQLKGPDFVYYIYIVDDMESRRLRGVITLRHLLVGRDDQCVEELMRPDMETIHALEPAVTAAHRVVDNHLAALPVIGKDGRLLGGVTADSAIALIAPASWRQQAPRVFS